MKINNSAMGKPFKAMVPWRKLSKDSSESLPTCSVTRLNAWNKCQCGFPYLKHSHGMLLQAHGQIAHHHKCCQCRVKQEANSFAPRASRRGFMEQERIISNIYFKQMHEWHTRICCGEVNKAIFRIVIAIERKVSERSRRIIRPPGQVPVSALMTLKYCHYSF